ncbi:hypothetical protein [Rhodothermus profundi]|uniref:Uncharacterized protein n=1 Tax=Rhodothermus profundi TaxID=633813 RepID=A0A1M6TVN2_9BACT|nr:hypothetical protein [Rhodothermus profundi]SHK61007.1 hypothetical protein SAMN04488087_1553 [Rhodothermus profundi]
MSALHLACFAVMLLPVRLVYAQPLIDTLFVWQGYRQEGRCRVQLYRTPPGTDRSYVVVLQELAENAGPSTIADARYLAERLSRQFGFNPTQAYWVFHWGAFSFRGARASAKELFLRATFSRSSSGRLSAPRWQVITRADVERLTDRQFH